MTKSKKGAKASTAKPCPHPDDNYTVRLVDTHRGHVVISSGDTSVTRDAVAAVSAFFENEANGFREPAAIHPSWSTAVLLDDFGDMTELVVSGPDAELVDRAGTILAAAFDIELLSDSDEPEDPRDDAKRDEVACCSPGEACDGCEKADELDDIDDEARRALLRVGYGIVDRNTVAMMADPDDALVKSYAELGAVYSAYARALESSDGEVADRCALSMLDLETRIEKLEAASLGDWKGLSDRDLKAINPEARAERIFAAKDARRGRLMNIGWVQP